MSALALAARAAGRTYRDQGREVEAIRDTTLEVPEGRFVALVGPSACGKSSLLRLFCGLDAPDSGMVASPLLGAGPLLGRVGYMPQHDLLMPWRDVTGNASLGLECLGVPRAEARGRALDLMTRFGLQGFEHAYPGQLSVGMCQRVAMLRTFLCGRGINLLDEPFGKLDAFTRASMQAWLLDYWQENRCTIVFVTHDIDEALLLADEVHLMSPRPGRIVLSLPVDIARPRSYGEVVTSPEFVALKARLLAELGRSR